MAKAATNDKTNAKSAGKPRPYAPSWIDRFTAWVDRLPGSKWLYYPGLGLILLLIQAAALWREGAYPVGSLSPFHLFFAGAMPFFLLMFHVLDDAADEALATLRPILKVAEEYDELRYRLTTLPARSTLLAGLAILGITFLLERGKNPFAVETSVALSISGPLVYLIYKICWWIFGALTYHTIYRLRLIDRILTRHTRVNLFRMRPLYAFSKLTALTAIGYAIAPYAFFALDPSMLNDPITLVIASLVLILAITIFAWPLLGIRRLLAIKKGQMLDGISLRFEAATIDLHERMDRDALDGISDLNVAVATLEIERTAIEKISTWPWQPETLRFLVTTLVLPLVLWISQYLLQRVLGS